MSTVERYSSTHALHLASGPEGGRPVTPSHPIPVVPGADVGPSAGAAPSRDPVVTTVRQALETPRLTITRMSEELGIPRGTLEAYRLGVRRMPAPARRRLAEYLVRHAESVRAVAQSIIAIEDLR